MNVWVAFIIINVTANPLVLDTKPHGPFDVTAKPADDWGPGYDKAGKPLDPTQPPPKPDNPQFHMSGTSGKDWTIGSMIGVQANTAVSTPTSATFDFEDEAACNKARDMLAKQFGVASVSCIQVQRR